MMSHLTQNRIDQLNNNNNNNNFGRMGMHEGSHHHEVASLIGGMALTEGSESGGCTQGQGPASQIIESRSNSKSRVDFSHNVNAQSKASLGTALNAQDGFSPVVQHQQQQNRPGTPSTVTLMPDSSFIREPKK